MTARVVWDERAKVWRGGAFVTGGSPWGLVRVAPPARSFVRRLVAAGRWGVTPTGKVEQVTAGVLVERGIAHPAVQPRPTGQRAIVVVPAHDRVELLDRCLHSLDGMDVLVVDDASADAEGIRLAADRNGARVVRHRANLGPGAARNTGLADTDAPFVAFLDSDCTTPPGWLDALLPHFDDVRVGAVAPRVRARSGRQTLVATYEVGRSALDMGRRRAIVRPGGDLGFVPSAALVVRREALDGQGFDARMRVGEDVDLVWRLADRGWHVRYEPAVEVVHEVRAGPLAWVRQRFEYGTSAAELDRRHPGRLAPIRPSAWNVAAAALLLAGRPRAAATATLAGMGVLGWRVQRGGAPPTLAVLAVGKGLAADVTAMGHALRREWWPLGWSALLMVGKSRLAAAAAASMLGPVALDLLSQAPRIDAFRYVLMRMVDDAAYGTGVIVGAVRGRRLGPLLPQPRWPSLKRPVRTRRTPPPRSRRAAQRDGDLRPGMRQTDRQERRSG